MKKLFLWIKAYWNQFWSARDYAKTRQKVRLIDLWLAATGPREPLFEERPDHAATQEAIDTTLRNLSSTQMISTIAYADSIMAFPKESLTAVSPAANAARAGMWSHHMETVIRGTAKKLREKRPKYIILSTGAGNPLLAYQPLELVLLDMLSMFNVAREEYPRSILIIYGLPPVSRMYVLQNAPAVEEAAINWVMNDQNAVFLALQKNYAGMLGIYPKARITNDNIHHTPIGEQIFDDELNQAKKGPYPRIIF